MSESGGYCPAPSSNPAGRYSPVPGFLTSYRPRGSLARALYGKYQSDLYLQSFDKEEWYKCYLTGMPEHISSTFVQLQADEATLNFLAKSEEKSDLILTQIWHYLARTILSAFMTKTSINGWLQRGSMFVISTGQFHQLLHNTDFRGESLLDLGAGDGEVTAELASCFNRVYATEISTTMQSLLRKRGYETIDIDKWQIKKKYDMISCLNLLDRCDRPLDILEEMRSSLTPNGMVLLALVLPFSAYVEASKYNDHKPTQLLPITGHTFEDQVVSLITDVILPAGLQVVSWSRVPYLCEGDLEKSYYWLDDIILLLKNSAL